MKCVLYEKDKHREVFKKAHEDPEFRKRIDVRGGKLKEPKEGDQYHLNLVAVDDSENTILGFCFASINGISNAYIDLVYVLPEHRKTGVASYMIGMMENRIDADFPIKQLRALTIENPAMEAVLHKKGFFHKGTYEDFVYRDGEYLDQSLLVKTKKKEIPQYTVRQQVIDY